MLSKDHTQSQAIIHKMHEVYLAQHELVTEAGTAEAIKDFTTRRYENLLAKYMKPFLDKGMSAAKADVLARNEAGYQSEFELLAKQHEDACVSIKKWEDGKSKFEAQRSIMSYSKHIANDLMG